MIRTQMELKIEEAKKHYPLPNTWMEIIEALVDSTAHTGLLYETDDWVKLHDGRIRQIIYFDDIGWARGDDFEVPVTKIERKATQPEIDVEQERIRWDKIGRLPGEFKEGDIVQHRGQTFLSVVVSISCTTTENHQGYFRIESQTLRVTGDIYRHSEIECENYELTLMAPQEARFDHPIQGGKP